MIRFFRCVSISRTRHVTHSQTQSDKMEIVIHISGIYIRWISDKSQFFLQILGLSHTYLRHISDIFQAYVRHSSTIYKPFLRHFSTIFQAKLSISQVSYLSHISGISNRYLRLIVGIIQACFTQIFGISQENHSKSQTYLKGFTGIYYSYLRQISGKSQVYLWYIFYNASLGQSCTYYSNWTKILGISNKCF